MDKHQQQVAAYVFGVVFVIVMLVIAMVVPRPSDFQYLVFRVVLSLAAAGVAAMIPGFIDVNVPRVIRAGGALGVFLVVFFYNPASLVAQPQSSPSEIEPLRPPIIDRTPKTGLYSPVTSSPAVLVPASFQQPLQPQESTPTNGIKVAQLLEGKSPDGTNRLFDLTLSNATDSQVLLSRFDVRWRYNHGFQASVDRSAALLPITKYVIDLPVDTDDEQWKTFSQVMSPSIALAPGSPKNPTLVTLRLQLHYHFAGRLDYHPAGDWNILFTIGASSSTGQTVIIFKNARWRDK